VVVVVLRVSRRMGRRYVSERRSFDLPPTSWAMMIESQPEATVGAMVLWKWESLLRRREVNRCKPRGKGDNYNFYERRDLSNRLIEVTHLDFDWMKLKVFQSVV